MSGGEDRLLNSLSLYLNIAIIEPSDFICLHNDYLSFGTGDMVQLIECLPPIHKDLGLIPSTK